MHKSTLKQIVKLYKKDYGVSLKNKKITSFKEFEEHLAASTFNCTIPLDVQKREAYAIIQSESNSKPSTFIAVVISAIGITFSAFSSLLLLADSLGKIKTILLIEVILTLLLLSYVVYSIHRQNQNNKLIAYYTCKYNFLKDMEEKTKRD